MRHRQLAAIVALIVGVATIVFAVVNTVNVFPRGLIVLVCVVVAAVAAWYGLLRRGAARAVGLTVAGVALAGVVVVIVAAGARCRLGRVHRRGSRGHRGDQRRDHVPGLCGARVRVAPRKGRRLRLSVAAGPAVS